MQTYTPCCLITNYLRVRGEYCAAVIAAPQLMELPPRARRIRTAADVSPGDVGTTSACAENTPPIAPIRYHPRNYLRVRGEYGWTVIADRVIIELPPRARRILCKRTRRVA